MSIGKLTSNSVSNGSADTRAIVKEIRSFRRDVWEIENEKNQDSYQSGDQSPYVQDRPFHQNNLLHQAPDEGKWRQVGLSDNTRESLKNLNLKKLNII